MDRLPDRINSLLDSSGRCLKELPALGLRDSSDKSRRHSGSGLDHIVYTWSGLWGGMPGSSLDSFGMYLKGQLELGRLHI